MIKLIQHFIDDYFPVFSSNPPVSDTWLRVVGTAIDFEGTKKPYLQYILPRR